MVSKKDWAAIDAIVFMLATDGYLSRDVRKVVREVGAKIDSGCFRHAFILPSAVVKVAQSSYNQYRLREEAAFITKMLKNPTYGKHFPQTVVQTVGGVTFQIQERIPLVRTRKPPVKRVVIDRLADKLGINDIHPGNYGFKGNTPVFIDVDFRDEYKQEYSTYWR